ncbi:SpdD-like protein [Streptomyces albicerus]|uniref:SpdD-like protein n=1 Tax=Streptomyces albicerus TaxID=2569859 RepID=UPI00124B6CAE|nr:SpdD-like protein [Streptomyces albicerus]
MFQPRVPVNPTPTREIVPVVTPTAIEQPHHNHAPSHCYCQNPAPARTSVQLTPGSLMGLAVVGGGVVLVVGAVLVSLLLAVAITGVSVAICALVIRSLVTTDATRR